MRQLNQTKFQKGTTEYQNVASPNGEVKAFRVNNVSGNLEYTNDYTNWAEVGGGQEVLTGAADPTNATAGDVGQFYLNTTSGQLFQCKAAGGGSYTWGYPNVNQMTLDTEQTVTAAKTWSSEDNYSINEEIVSTDGFMANRTEKNDNTLYNATLIPDGVQLYTENDDGSNKLVGLLCDGNITVIDDDGQGTSSMSNVEIRNTGNDEQFAYLSDMFPTFSSSNTYAVGDKVNYEGSFYKCTTAVTTAGAWTGSTNWAAVTLSDLLDEKANASDVVTLDTTEQTFTGNKTLNLTGSLSFKNSQSPSLYSVNFNTGDRVNVNTAGKEITLFGNRMVIKPNAGSSSTVTVNYPTQAGTLALTDDIPTNFTTQEIETICDDIFYPALPAPTNVTASGTTISFNEVQGAESYVVYANGNEIGEVTA